MPHSTPDGLVDAQRAVEQVIGDHATVIGPSHLDADGDPTVIIDGALLSEFTLVMCWIDPASGESYITKISSETMRAHHELGLLRMGLQLLDE